VPLDDIGVDVRLIGIGKYCAACGDCTDCLSSRDPEVDKSAEDQGASAFAALR
jgi:hypothetical protein